MSVKLFFQKIRTHIVFRNMSALFLLQIFSNIFPFLTLPILSRYLGIETFGTYVWLLAITSGVTVFTDAGLGMSAIYKIASHQKDKQYIEKLVSSIVFSKLVLGSVVSAGVIGYVYFIASVLEKTHHHSIYIIFLVTGIIFTEAFKASWFFQGIEKMKMITLTIGIAKLIYLTSIYCLIPLFPTLEVALFCIFLNNLFVDILYLYFFKKEGYHWGSISLIFVIKNIYDGVGIFISNLANSCRNSLNLIVLGSYAVPQQTALYGAADRLHNGGMSLLSPLSQAFFPHNARTGKIGLLLKVTAILSIPLALGLLLIAWQAPYILHLIFGEAFIDAAPLLRWFLLLIFIKFFTTSLGYAVFSAWKQLHIMNRVIYFATLVYLLGLGCLIVFHQITALHLLYLQIAAEVILAILILWCIFHRFWIKN